MTQQANGTSESDKQLSDDEQYDLEWSKEEGNDQPTSESDSNDDGSSNDGGDSDAKENADAESSADTAKVSDGQDEASPEDSSEHSAEGVDEDIWANATPAQKTAFLKAQNDFKSVIGRHSASEKKAVALEKELKEKTRALTEATREKGVYEQENPELFDEVVTAVKSQLPQQKEDSTDDEQATDGEAESLKPVFKAHPDINDVMASEDWAEFTKDMSVEQQAQFNSEDPFDFIQLVNDFKVVKALKADSTSKDDNDSKDDDLEDGLTPAGGSASQASKQKTVMTDEQAYEAEWAKED